MIKILAWFASGLSKLFADKVIGFLALKVVLVFLFIVVIPILLNNFLYDLIEIMMNFSNSQINSSGTMNGTMSFSGLAAWLIDCFQLSQALSVMVSALVLRSVLSMIPFVRL